MRILLSLLFLFFSFTPSYAASGISIKITPSHIEGDAVKDIKIEIFDGIELKGVGIDKGFRIEHNITSGYYGAIFFVKVGFYPQLITFKASEGHVQGHKISLKKIKEKNKGVLTGIVYTPVTGGKIKEHKGIFRLFKNAAIEIVKGSAVYKTRTNDNGAFVITLTEGEYKIIVNGKAIEMAVIKKGETTIKNLQKGLVMID